MKPIVIISGPTTSGKSNLAVILAQEMDAVIINADAMQIYKEIPMITAQPTLDEQQGIPHKLYGVVSASIHSSVMMWLDMAVKEIKTAIGEGKTPILVGGTGMYIKALCEGIAPLPAISEETKEEVQTLYNTLGPDAFFKQLQEQDPEMAAKLKAGDSQRQIRAMEVLIETGESLSVFQNLKPEAPFPSHDMKLFFLELPRETLYARCNSRFQAMINQGVIDEIKALDSMHLSPSLPAMRAHGVPEILEYLHGTLTLEAAIERAQRNTRHYVKRQFTWFRHQMPGAIYVNNEDVRAAATTIRGYLL